MENHFWARAFGWTPSQVAGESALDMARIRYVHGAYVEGRRRAEEDHAG